MVRTLLRLVSLVVPCLLAVTLAAGEQDGWPDPKWESYWHNSNVAYRLPDWMSRLADGTRLDAISLVGTHDSGSRHGTDMVETQSLSIRDQLEMGVRALDLRFKHKGNSLHIYHGIVDQHLPGREAVGQVVDFLRAHPTETVLIRMKEEERGSPNTNTFEAAFREQVYDHFAALRPGIFWKGGHLPTLGEARGRIVILQNFGAHGIYGPSYGAADIQDDYTLSTNWDLYGKWEKVRAHLDKAKAVGPGQRLFINYLSGSEGAFPYFVASGKSSPGTGAPRLATGFTTPGWKDKYPDFPRVDCFIGICTICFEGTNALTVRHLWKTPEPRRIYAGILMADFPGPLLVHTVVRLNTFVK